MKLTNNNYRGDYIMNQKIEELILEGSENPMYIPIKLWGCTMNPNGGRDVWLSLDLPPVGECSITKRKQAPAVILFDHEFDAIANLSTRECIDTDKEPEIRNLVIDTESKEVLRIDVQF